LTTELHDTVLAYVATLDPVAPWYWTACSGFDAPIFQRDADGTVTHLSGKPPVMTVLVEVLKRAAEDGISWDGRHLRFPGDLVYRPVGVDAAGETLLCELVPVINWVTDPVSEPAFVPRRDPDFHEDE
jgi:hypothetical protein